MRLRLLPWEYGVRNLFRRPLASALTLGALTLVVLLVFVVVGFIRGLETSLAVSGDPRVVLIHALGSSENLENSSIPGRTAALLTASSIGVQTRSGVAYTSPELYLGTRVGTAGHEQTALGLVRGVTPAALLVRQSVQLVEGRWPGPGEVLVGRLASTKLGREDGSLDVGQTIRFEGREWRVSGTFAAKGSSLESGIRCLLEELQLALKRQDLSIVALTLGPGASYGNVQEFCIDRLDLELEATAETVYYQSLQKHYRPVRLLAWLVVLLLVGAGAFAGLVTMYVAVVGRVRELATLQTLGFTRQAIALSLIQESVLLAAAASLLAALVALTLVNGLAVRFTMGAFVLAIDNMALAAGCGTGLLLGLCGAAPPAVGAMLQPVANGLKAI